MPTARSAALRVLAQRVVERLPPFVTDVVLTGSTSRGEADELSDVEVLVVVDELPPLAECAAAAGLEDLDTWVNPESPIHWVGGFCENEFVELIWWPRAFDDERVRRIAAAEIVDHQRLRTAEAIVNGVALRGERHAGWAEELATYPVALAGKIVAAATADWLEPTRSARALLRPGDGLVLAARLVEDAENVLRVVFAVNHAWEPGWKRVATRLAGLERQPKRLAERIEAAVRGLDLAAMRALAAEALELAPPTPELVRARALLAEPLD